MNEKKKEPFFHIVKRDALPWYQSVGIRAIAIVLALIVCAIVTTITTGINPIQVYESMIIGAFGSARKTWVTFQNISILLLTANQYLSFSTDIPELHLEGRCQSQSNQ